MSSLTGRPPSFYLYSNDSIFADFSVSFQTLFQTTLGPNNKILMVFPQYDVGVLPDEGQVTCKAAAMTYK